MFEKSMLPSWPSTGRLYVARPLQASSVITYLFAPPPGHLFAHCNPFRRTVVHCNENPIYVFPEKELSGLSPNYHIQLSVSNLYLPRICQHIWLQLNTVGRPILGI
jgi:hypothetical protein